MKKIIIPFMALLCVVLFQRCSHDNDVSSAAKVNVTFGFQTPGASNGRQQSMALDGSVKLRVSLSSPSGDSVFLHKEFTILNFGEGYVTEPVALVPGNYRITEFMLVNDSSVLYATPLAGSPLAKAVTHALPYIFGVQANKVSNIDMQVLSVAEHTPAQFGYASFHATIVRPLPIAVFAMGNTPSLTSSTVYIIKDRDTLQTQMLGANAGYVFFNLDPDETYEMIVFKDGYSYLDKTFVYNDLMAGLQGDPLQVYLQPALTMKLNLNEEYFYRGCYFTLTATTAANVMINWGDGTSTEMIATDFSAANHKYPDASPSAQKIFYITITGELHKITQVDLGTVDGELIDMNFDHLPSLTDVWLFGVNTTQMVLDLRKNSKLEHFVFGGAGVLLPPTSNLRSVILFNTSLASSLDYIIHNVYENALTKNITGGEFFYTTNPDSPGEIPLAIPSAAAQEELNMLNWNLSWNIIPNL